MPLTVGYTRVYIPVSLLVDDENSYNTVHILLGVVHTPTSLPPVPLFLDYSRFPGRTKYLRTVIPNM